MSKPHIDKYHPSNNRQQSYNCECGALHKIWFILRDKPEKCVYCQADIDYTIIKRESKKNADS